MIILLVFVGILIGLSILLIRKHRVDSRERKKTAASLLVKRFQLPATQDVNAARFHLYVVLSAWLVKKNATKSVEKEEFIRNYLSTKFSFSMLVIQGELDKAKASSIHIRSVANWVVQCMPNRELRSDLIDFLIELVFTDGDLIDREFTALVRLGELIGVQVTYIEKQVIHFRKLYLGTHFTSSKLADIANVNKRRKMALALLDLTGDATFEEIKRNYRRLVKQYHPDKVGELPEEERATFTQRFLEIQDAYEELQAILDK